MPKVRSHRELLVWLAEEDNRSSRNLQGSENKINVKYLHVTITNRKSASTDVHFIIMLLGHFILQHAMFGQAHCDAKPF